MRVSIGLGCRWGGIVRQVDRHGSTRNPRPGILIVPGIVVVMGLRLRLGIIIIILIPTPKIIRIPRLPPHLPYLPRALPVLLHIHQRPIIPSCS